MANICEFDIHAVSKNEEAIKAVKDGFMYNKDEEISFGAIYDSFIYDEGFNKETGEYFIYITGDCKWSIQSGILDYNLLQKVIEKYALDLEAYSEEPGLQFMEHYRWEGGEKVVDEETPFVLIHIDNIEDETDEADEFFMSQMAKDACITRDNYESFADDEGYIKLGGFDYMWVIN